MESKPLLASRSLWHRSLARQSPVLGSPRVLSCYASQAQNQNLSGAIPLLPAARLKSKP